MQQDPSTEKIAVIGAGAVGGVTAGFMKAAGWDPILVCKHRAVAEQINGEGLRIDGVKGRHRIALTAVEAIDDLPGDIAFCFLATKANDCIAAAEALRPHLTDRALLVSLQNGIVEAELARVIGDRRVIGCVVGWGATHVAPAALEVTSMGEFVIGNWDRRCDPARLRPVQEMLQSVQPTRTTTNIVGELYAKLIINACINSLGVVTGATLGELLASRRIRRLFIAMIREAMTLADAMGIRVEPAAGGKLDYYRLLAGDGTLAALRRDLFIRVIGFKYRRIKSSSLQSLERGRPTEIDTLNGYICDHARRHGIAVPVHDAVVGMVHQIQNGSRLISPANLDDSLLSQLARAASG